VVRGQDRRQSDLFGPNLGGVAIPGHLLGWRAAPISHISAGASVMFIAPRFSSRDLRRLVPANRQDVVALREDPAQLLCSRFA
jgi:hypothetical protein